MWSELRHVSMEQYVLDATNPMGETKIVWKYTPPKAEASSQADWAVSFPIYAWAYAVSLFVILLGACISRRAAMIRTAIAITLNWLACVGIVYWLNQPDPWLAFAIFDAIACLIITIHPAARMQAVIGSCFVAEILCSFIYGISSNPDASYYLQVLDKLSFVQLMLFVFWLMGGSVVRIARAASHHRFWNSHRILGKPPAPRVG